MLLFVVSMPCVKSRHQAPDHLQTECIRTSDRGQEASAHVDQQSRATRGEADSLD